MNSFRVGDQYRTNDLSFIPGGRTVIVEYKDGRSFQYDNIKNTRAYINKSLKNNAVKTAYVK